MYIITGLSAIIVLLMIAVFLFLNQKSFGRLPEGERLERIRRSPNYRDGEFRNEHVTPLLTSERSRLSGLLNFIFRKKDGLVPDDVMQVVHTDVKAIPRDRNCLVWFGHSSYLIQLDGKRILVDPVFRVASPVSFVNKPFKGTDIYAPEDMPDIDYLIITHDHWDHLDYQTVCELKPRVKKIVCGLGVGASFERWGFDSRRLVELDWNEDAVMDSGFTIHCLPARHFSGRGLTSNKTLWASFLLETPSQKIYMSGDGGYDTHFSRIGRRFPAIDLAILENGQYNSEWKYIHLLPDDLIRAAKDLKAKKILTVHHSKYALAKHRWDEPHQNALRLARELSSPVLMPQIGEVVDLTEP